MSKLTLDEAIKHCLEVAGQNDTQADKWQEEGGEEWGKTTACRECAAEHRQLAEWLTELKELREENKVLTSECDRLIKEKGELNELKEKAVSDIWRREAKLREAKRLLKAAVEDFSEVQSYLSEPYSHLCDKWRYEDEALKLIEG